VCQIINLANPECGKRTRAKAPANGGLRLVMHSVFGMETADIHSESVEVLTSVFALAKWVSTVAQHTCAAEGANLPIRSVALNDQQHYL